MTCLDTSACTAYVLAKAREVVAFGPRPPGSPAEKRAQHLVQSELQSCCDGDVPIESFPVAPKAFMGQHRVCAVLLLLATAGYWVSPWCAAPFSLLAFLIVLQEVVRYKQFIDPFFPKHTSHNVHGRQRPAEEIKRRVVLNGHPDAAYEWFFLYRFPRLFPLCILYSLAGMIAKPGIDLAFLLLSHGWAGGYAGIWVWIGLGHILLLPAFAIGFLFTDFRHVSPGANDNLTGTFIPVAIAKHLHATGERLQHAELVVLITGSEEAGLRGAKAFVKAHPDFADDIETVFITIDTMRDLEHFKVYHRDLNATVKHDPAVCALLQNAGRTCGLDLPLGSVFLGSSDATAFTQHHWRAAALAAMDPAPADYYHNRRDSPDNMSPECIGATIDVLLAALKHYDLHGLPTPENSHSTAEDADTRR